MSDQRIGLDRLERLARWTAVRLRLDETLARLALLLPIPLVYAIGALTYIKVARPPKEVVETLALVSLLPLGVFVGGVLHALLRARPPHRGALALDRYHGLHDRIT